MVGRLTADDHPPPGQDGIGALGDPRQYWQSYIACRCVGDDLNRQR